MAIYKKYVLVFFLIYVACLLKSVENEECKAKPNYLSGNETHQVELDKECTVFVYEHETVSEKSISRIILINAPLNETANGTSATVIIQEYIDTERKYVTVNDDPWTINSNERFKRSYFSESIKIKITFITTERWINSNVSLCYEEVEFKTFVRSSSETDKNEITPWNEFDDDWHYRPNSNYTFYIQKNNDLSTSNILITLNELDKDPREYLLIGAGSQPFEGPPPLCITEAVEQKKYLVDDEAAYIMFITNATSRNYRGFNISWNYKGTQIEKPEIDEKEDVKESAPICIYNITAADEELSTRKKTGDYFKDFRENFAKVATDYANINGKLLSSDDIISPASVSVFRISGKFKDDKSHEAYYAMVKIRKNSTEGKAEFKQRKQLEEIISRYSEKASSKKFDDIFEFRTCGARYVPESWFYFGLILIIPVICFALLLWIWKQNPIAEHYEKKRKLKRASFTRRSQHEQSLNPRYYDVDNCDFVVPSAAENHYTTLPKIQLINELGRRTTLNLSDTLLCGDNGSDDELFNKYFANKRRSDVLELQRMRRTDRLFLTNEGEDNAAFEMEQHNNAATEQRQHEDRADHTYESVKSSASLCENTRL